MTEKQSDERKLVKDQEPKYGSLKHLFKGIEKGDVKSLKYGDADASGTTYLVGSEGKGRGAKPRVLWKGDRDDLLTELLKRVGVKVLEQNADFAKL